MLFGKKSDQPPSTDGVAKKSIKNMDAVVTGVILGGIIASLYGVKKLKDRSSNPDEEHQHLVEPPKVIERKSFWRRLFWK
jgi:hypothetical protein